MPCFVFVRKVMIRLHGHTLERRMMMALAAQIRVVAGIGKLAIISSHEQFSPIEEATCGYQLEEGLLPKIEKVPIVVVTVEGNFFRIFQWR